MKKINELSTRLKIAKQKTNRKSENNQNNVEGYGVAT